MAGLSPKTQGHHHNLTTAVLAHEEKDVAQLTATIERFMNPFCDTHPNLFNFVTKVVMPEAVKEDLCEHLWKNESSLAKLTFGRPWRRENS